METGITNVILGSKGCGKSVMLAADLNKRKQGILIDTIGVYNPKSSYKTAIIPKSLYFEDPYGFIDRCQKKGTIPKKSIISTAELVGDELVFACDDLFKFIYQNIPKMPILVDEVADILPGTGGGSKEFHRLVKNGRNHGNNPIIFATQRPQSVSKQVFDLCDTFFIATQKAPRTMDYVLDILDEKGNDELKKQIKGLKPRHFLRYDGEARTIYTEPTYKYAFKQK